MRRSERGDADGAPGDQEGRGIPPRLEDGRFLNMPGFRGCAEDAATAAMSSGAFGETRPALSLPSPASLRESPPLGAPGASLAPSFEAVAPKRRKLSLPPPSRPVPRVAPPDRAAPGDAERPSSNSLLASDGAQAASPPSSRCCSEPASTAREMPHPGSRATSLSAPLRAAAGALAAALPGRATAAWADLRRSLVVEPGGAVLFSVLLRGATELERFLGSRGAGTLQGRASISTSTLSFPTVSSPLPSASLCAAARAMCWERLHSGRWDRAPLAWRDAHAAASCLEALELLARGRWRDAARQLDLAAILGGGSSALGARHWSFARERALQGLQEEWWDREGGRARRWTSAGGRAPSAAGARGKGRGENGDSGAGSGAGVSAPSGPAPDAPGSPVVDCSLVVPRLSVPSLVEFWLGPMGAARRRESAARRRPGDPPPLSAPLDVSAASAPSPPMDPSFAYPVVVCDLACGWPAMRLWRDGRFLLRLVGSRTVPVEEGDSFLDPDVRTRLVPFADLLERWHWPVDGGSNLAPNGAEEPQASSEPSSSSSSSSSFTCSSAVLRRSVQYLAQHPLLDQIPVLREHIRMPDYLCLERPSGDGGGEARNAGQTRPSQGTALASPANPALDECGAAVDSALADPEAPPDLSPSVSASSPESSAVSCPAPLLNAWFGPAGTYTPPHVDPRDNLLVQLVGRKRVTLWPPQEAAKLYPHPAPSRHVNASRVDGRRPDRARFPRFFEAARAVVVLEPGEALFLPRGWWHDVEALEPSASISIWWGGEQPFQGIQGGVESAGDDR